MSRQLSSDDMTALIAHGTALSAGLTLAPSSQLLLGPRRDTPITDLAVSSLKGKPPPHRDGTLV